MDMDTEVYATAICKLVTLAQGDYGGSRVAAQILLSAYNGEAYQLNIVDLCILDENNYQAALLVIRGRVELGREPQTFLKNGDKIFRDLWNRWERYHVKNRAKPDCSNCNGRGFVFDNSDDDESYAENKCPLCKGKGY